MGEPKEKPPVIVSYGSIAAKIYERGDGRFSISWREGGKTHRTTRTDLDAATAFARGKLKQLDQVTGRRWITPAQHERLSWLEKLAGGESETSNLLRRLDAAKKSLGSLERIDEAAAYFHSHGPAGVREITFADAAEVVIGEYRSQAKDSMIEMRTELRGLAKKHPHLPLLDLTKEILETHIFQPHYQKRTIRNKINRWNTFFNRCRTLGYWPELRKNPTTLFKKPRKDDKAAEIFTPDEGKRLLAMVKKSLPEFLPYLLLAGWLGLRPSECLRLRRHHFDFEHLQLHLPPAVVGKTARERWVPIPEDLAVALKIAIEEETHGKLTKNGKVCRAKSRYEISKLARSKGMKWPKDVLRHSAITYRLQIVQNIDQVAEESGNSPKIIRESYRRPIPPGWGEKWFDLLK